MVFRGVAFPNPDKRWKKARTAGMYNILYFDITKKNHEIKKNSKRKGTEKEG